MSYNVTNKPADVSVAHVITASSTDADVDSMS